jgi:hypothetical protein
VERRRGLGIMPLRTEALATNASAKQVALSSERDSDVAGDGRENRTAAGAHTSRRLARRGIGIPIGQCPALAGVPLTITWPRFGRGFPVSRDGSRLWTFISAHTMIAPPCENTTGLAAFVNLANGIVEPSLEFVAVQ